MKVLKIIPEIALVELLLCHTDTIHPDQLE